MSPSTRLSGWIIRGLTAGVLLILACAPPAQPSPAAAPAQSQAAAPAAKAAPTTAAATQKSAAKPATAAAESLDAVYENAKQEGGKLVLYSTLAQVNAEKLLPAFEKRFPGITVEHVDATSDKLVARAVAEARGGKTLGDVFNANMESVGQMIDQGLLEGVNYPEASEYPEDLRGKQWVASDLQFIIAAWNTNLVKKEDEPKQFDDFGDPKWKGKIIAEPRDLELLMGLAKHKFKNDDQAIELMKKIAANNVEFHSGHSELAEFLVAGQGAACLTCYSHHYPPRIAKGAPVNYLLAEGIGTINGTGIMKGAPHPNTAMLWTRWIASEEGQKELAISGRTPAHPAIEPVEKTRPEKIYALVPEDLKEWAKYEQIWKDVFDLR